MKMSSEQFAEEMIKDFPVKPKPITKSQAEEVEEKINQKMKEAAAEEEPELDPEDNPVDDTNYDDENEVKTEEDE